MYEEKSNACRVFMGNLKERYHLKDLGVTVFKENRLGGHGLELYGLGQGQMTGP
jgi:hypothetical protein